MTRLHANRPRIGDSIDRQSHDTHESKGPRPSHAPDRIDLVFIDNSRKEFRECRCCVEILREGFCYRLISVKDQEGDLWSEGIDVEGSVHSLFFQSPSPYFLDKK